MAFQIDYSSIPDNYRKYIKKNLTIKSSNTFNPFSPDEKILTVEFYTLLDGKLHLPYLFASTLFQIIPNINNHFASVPINFTGQLREYQLSVENEAFHHLETYGTTTLSLFPGFGKTVLGASLACRFKLLTVVLVHREILADQWEQTFHQNTSANVWIVGKKAPSSVDVIICMNTRFNLIPGWMRDLCGTLIIDEAHAFCTRGNVNCLLSFHPKYIIIESATLVREKDGMERMIYAMVGDRSIIRENIKPFTVLKINTGVVPKRKLIGWNKRLDYPLFTRSTLMNNERNAYIIKTVKNNTNKKILILTSLVDHTMLLWEMLKTEKIESEYMCGKKKKYTDSGVLIGTVHKIGTGFDPASACPNFSGQHFDLLLLVCSFRQTAALVQYVGRALRSDSPNVMHFVDDDDIYRSQWRVNKKWYISCGATIMEYDVNLKTGMLKEVAAQNSEDYDPSVDWLKLKIASLNKQ